MIQEFESTKDFSVGDLFLYHEEPLCFIVKITQWKKGAQYEYEVEYFKNRSYYSRKHFNTRRIKDKIQYWDWKHIPVVK